MYKRRKSQLQQATNSYNDGNVFEVQKRWMQYKILKRFRHDNEKKRKKITSLCGKDCIINQRDYLSDYCCAQSDIIGW